MRHLTSFLWAILAGIIMIWIGGGTPVEADNNVDDGKCYEQITKQLIVKSTRTILEIVDGEPVWSEPRLWDGIAIIDDGRPRGPLPHNNVTPGTVGYREYFYSLADFITYNGDEIPCPPETTVPPYVPPTFVPTTPPPPIVDECWIGDDPRNPIPSGGFVYFDNISDPGAVGTHSRTGTPCGPTPTTTTTPTTVPATTEATSTTAPTTTAASTTLAPTTVAPTTTTVVDSVGVTLPATGTSNWELVAVAALALALGGSALWAARR